MGVVSQEFCLLLCLLFSFVKDGESLKIPCSVDLKLGGKNRTEDNLKG